MLEFFPLCYPDGSLATVDEALDCCRLQLHIRAAKVCSRIPHANEMLNAISLQQGIL